MEMSLDESKRVIDKITGSPCVKILFQGGEPFERPDFFEIMEYARKRGAAVSVDTNSWFLNADKIKKLRGLDVESINITIYGTTAKVNDSFTREGHFDHILEVLNSARNDGLEIHLALLVTRMNFGQIFKIGGFAKKFGVKKVHVDVFLCDKNFKHREKYQLGFFQLFFFWLIIRVFLKLFSSRIHAKPKFKNNPLINVSICDCNKFPLIKSNGDFWPCLFYEKSIGNILYETPGVLWERLSGFNFGRGLCCSCLEKKLDGLGQKIMSSNKCASKAFAGAYRLYLKIIRRI